MVGALLGVLICLFVVGGAFALFILRKSGVYGRHHTAGALNKEIPLDGID